MEFAAFDSLFQGLVLVPDLSLDLNCSFLLLGLFFFEDVPLMEEIV